MANPSTFFALKALFSRANRKEAMLERNNSSQGLRVVALLFRTDRAGIYYGLPFFDGGSS